MDFVYPQIPNNELPRSNPYGISSTILPWKWINKKWDIPIQHNIDYIKKTFSDVDGRLYLPIGTRLYHGSINQDLDFRSLKNDRITFFGLDIIIALWYILERQRSYIHFRKGKIYEFIVVEPIPLYLLFELYDNPKDNSHCSKEGIACIHPQIVFHGDESTEPPYDLSIELTMNMKYFKDYIKLRHTHIVDPAILYDNRNKLFSEFDPTKSITDIELSDMKSGGKRRSCKKKISIRKLIVSKSLKNRHFKYSKV